MHTQCLGTIVPPPATMPRNVEIKARLPEEYVDRIWKAVRECSSGEPVYHPRQVDTFYKTSEGRLKHREFVGEDVPAHIIYYQRPDQQGPKQSSFVIIPITGRYTIHGPVIGRVVKERRVYLHGTTRIHIDRVDGLGFFLELEAQLADAETEADGQKRAEELMTQLGIQHGWLEKGAYVDLLFGQQGKQ